jgi:hypothetical protein
MDLLQIVPSAEVGIDVAVLSELLMETGAMSVVVEDADRGTDREMPVFNEPDNVQAFRTGGVCFSDPVELICEAWMCQTRSDTVV